MNAKKVFLVVCLTDCQQVSEQSGRAIVQARTFKLNSTEGKQFVDLYYTAKAANAEASRRASMEPTKLFVVFETVSYYETTMPDVIEKVFNDRGEFVLKQKENTKIA